MKRITLTLIAAIAFCGVSMSQNHPRQQPNPEMQAQRITNQMAKEYKLTDEQKAELLELNKEYAGKVDMPRMRGNRHPGMNRPAMNRQGMNRPQANGNHQAKPRRELTEEQKEQFKATAEKRKAEREESTKEYNKKLKKILTKEQYKAYEEKLAKREAPRDEKK